MTSKLKRATRVERERGKQKMKKGKQNERRMASFRLKNETIAKLHYLIEDGVSHNMTMLIEDYIETYFNHYINTKGIDESDALQIGYDSINKNKKRKIDTEKEKEEIRRVIKQMENM